MNGQKQLSPDVAGVTIAVLVFLLLGSLVAIFWEAQVIAKQEAVIRMQLEGK
jgi:hypothetical protein